MSNKRKSGFNQYLISMLAVAVVAGIGFLFVNFLGYKVVAYLMLVMVSILAMLFDIFPVLLAAVVSALVWDYFFIPPQFTFTIGTAEDRWLLLMYFIIASVNAVLTYKIRQIEKVAREKEEKENSIKLYNTLFNSLSHEFQTPIATIIGATDTLKENEAKLSGENKTELVEEISIASLRLSEQVENLLNISRIESGYIKLKKDWCDVNELIYSAVNKLQNKAGKHQMEVRIAENFPLVELDFGIMEQVLHNLLNNALQYTPENAIISITAECTKTIVGHFDEDLTQGELHRDSTVQKLTITVSDNGKGFPENEIEKVFDKFYRLQNSKAGGTGLGLSIVKGFVEAHNGTVKLRNLPAGGAEFTIEIPTKTSYLNALKNE